MKQFKNLAGDVILSILVWLNTEAIYFLLMIVTALTGQLILASAGQSEQAVTALASSGVGFLWGLAIGAPKLYRRRQYGRTDAASSAGK